MCVCEAYKRLTLTTANMAEVVKRKIIPPWVKNLKLSHGKSSCDFTNSRIPCTNHPKRINETHKKQNLDKLYVLWLSKHSRYTFKPKLPHFLAVRD